MAPDLLGWVLRTRIDGVDTAVRLTEVEAYRGGDDPASHAHRGPTARTRPMFGPPGALYVYLSYGIHSCVNVVTGPAGEGQAVLLRGGVPVCGLEHMVERRGRADHVADGPGKLGQALGLGPHDSGHAIDGHRIALEPGPRPPAIRATPRIGITRATDRHWRFIDVAEVPR